MEFAIIVIFQDLHAFCTGQRRKAKDGYIYKINSCTQGSGDIAKDRAGGFKRKRNRKFLEIVSPRNARKAMFTKYHQDGCLP